MERTLRLRMHLDPERSRSGRFRIIRLESAFRLLTSLARIGVLDRRGSAASRHDGCSTSDTTAAARSSRPAFVVALNGIICSSSSWSCTRDLVHSRRQLARAQLVDLRQHDDRRHADLGEEVEHLQVVLRRVVAHVEQLHDAAQRRRASQVPLDQRQPLRLSLLRDPRVAVARQVDEHELLVHLEEVDLARAARRVAHARERLAAHEPVEQRRLADVRAAGERDLRQLVRRPPAVRASPSAR